MPSVPPFEEPVVPRDDIRRLEQMITQLATTVDAIKKDQNIQFTRIAQLQADLDLIRAAWGNIERRDRRSDPRSTNSDSIKRGS
jgi:hypothetical protein